MTVSTTTSRKVYTADGSTTDFPTTFPFYKASDLQVTLVDQSSGVETLQTEGVGNDYTVTGGDGSNGTVKFNTAPASGNDVVIIREVPFTQLTDYVENDAFPAETHEEALDRAVMLAQQLNDQIGRAVKLAINTTLSDINLPEPGAGELLGWNDAGSSLTTVAPKDISTAIDLVLTGLANDDFIQRKSGQWVNRTVAEVAADLWSDIKSNIVGRQTLWIPAAAMWPTTLNGADGPNIYDPNSNHQKPNPLAIKFVAGSNKYVQFAFPFPKSWDVGNVSYRVWWYPSNADTEDVLWSCAFEQWGEDDALNDSIDNQQVILDAGIGTTEDIQVSAESTPAAVTDAAADKMLFSLFARLGANGFDNFTGDAYLLGIELFFDTDAVNDA